MKGRVFLCKDTLLTVIFQETETIGLENLWREQKYSIFKFWVIKSGETLSCLSIDIRIVTCGRQIGICINTRDYLCIVTRIALFCINLS